MPSLLFVNMLGPVIRSHVMTRLWGWLLRQDLGPGTGNASPPSPVVGPSNCLTEGSSASGCRTRTIGVLFLSGDGEQGRTDAVRRTKLGHDLYGQELGKSYPVKTYQRHLVKNLSLKIPVLVDLMFAILVHLYLPQRVESGCAVCIWDSLHFL